MAAKLTDAMVEFEGSEAFREGVWGLDRKKAQEWLAHWRTAVS